MGKTADGGILFCGFIDFLNGEYSGRLLKVDQVGHAFPGFQKVTGDGWILKAFELSNGKIMVMGDFTQLNGVTASTLSRLNSDGSLDQTFTTNLTVYDFAVQSTGKIVVLTSGGMFRLNSNGSLDNTFSSVAGNFQYGCSIALSSTDLIYLITNSSVLRRYTPNGAIDTGFSEVTSDGTFSAMQPTATGIIVAGFFTQVNSHPANKIALIKSNGTPDASFDVGGGPDIGQVRSLAVRANGNILVSGGFGSFNQISGSAFELSPTGELLQAIAQTYQWHVENILELSSQKILITGLFSTVNGQHRLGTALFNSDYTLDSGFKPDITYGATSFNYAPPVITSKDEMIFVGTGADNLNFVGAYHNNQPDNRQFLKIDSLGQIDQGYDLPGFYSPAWVRTLVMQPDDKLLIGGGSFKFGGPVLKLARLHPNGSIDNSFSFNIGENEFVNKVIRRDSVFLVCGKFNSVNGSPANSIAVVDWNGNFIKSYSGVPVDSNVLMMEAQSDGKLIIVLPVYGSNGELTYRLLRVKETGEIDETFQQADFYLQMEDIKIAESGKIYCAGQFMYYNGAIKNNLLRLNSNGSIDNTFVTSASPFASGYPMTIQLLPNENIIVGGTFPSYRGNTSHGIVQIDKNGNYVATPAFNFGKQSNVAKLTLVRGNLFATGRIMLNGNQKVISVAKFQMGISLKKPQLTASITNQDTGIAGLTWDDGSTIETGFEIQRSEKVQTNFSSIKTVAANATSYSETLAPFKKYFYKVRAISANGSSEFSNVVSVQWMPLPQAPTHLVISLENSAPQLSWTDNSSLEDGYAIQRTTFGAGLVSTTIDSTDVSNYRDVSATLNTVYVYRVFAYNVAGVSGFSNAAQSPVIAGVEDESLSFKVYPNPATSFVRVKVESKAAPAFEIINTAGSRCAVPINAVDENVFELNISSLPMGVYVLKVIANGHPSFQKVMKR